jgi:hypothetical protein
MCISFVFVYSNEHCWITLRQTHGSKKGSAQRHPSQSQSLVAAALPSLYHLHLSVVVCHRKSGTIMSPSMSTEHVDENGGFMSKTHGPPTSPRSSEGSQSSLIMARGRSRIRKLSSDADPFSEENLRKRYVSRHLVLVVVEHTLFLNIALRTVATIVSNRSTRLSAWKSDGNLYAKWVLERTAL